jgi:hypothetical protein
MIGLTHLPFIVTTLADEPASTMRYCQPRSEHRPRHLPVWEA